MDCVCILPFPGKLANNNNHLWVKFCVKDRAASPLPTKSPKLEKKTEGTMEFLGEFNNKT